MRGTCVGQLTKTASQKRAADFTNGFPSFFKPIGRGQVKWSISKKAEDWGYGTSVIHI